MRPTFLSFGPLSARITATFLLLMVGWLLAGTCAGAEKPNIVLLFIDDWAWNGSPIAMDDSMPNSRMPVLQMPNVERLAREGMKFTGAYASPQCSPSRVCVQTSVAGIPLSRQLDGMDLSHVLLGKEGQDREQVLINYGRGYFVRESRFRLNQDGKFYDIPVTSDKERYREEETADPAYEADRRRLQAALDQFLAIEREISPEFKGGKKSKSFKRKQR